MLFVQGQAADNINDSLISCYNVGMKQENEASSCHDVQGLLYVEPTNFYRLGRVAPNLTVSKGTKGRVTPLLEGHLIIFQTTFDT